MRDILVGNPLNVVFFTSRSGLPLSLIPPSLPPSSPWNDRTPPPPPPPPSPPLSLILSLVLATSPNILPAPGAIAQEQHRGAGFPPPLQSHPKLTREVVVVPFNPPPKPICLISRTLVTKIRT